MNSETSDPKPSHEDEDTDDNEVDDKVDFQEETVVIDEGTVTTDNVGDVSVEINVEQLIADIEANEDKDVVRKKEIRQRLEEMAEEKSFEDTYAIDLDKQSD